jgi:hypothetical protein
VERIFKEIIMSSEKSSAIKIVKHHPREKESMAGTGGGVARHCFVISVTGPIKSNIGKKDEDITGLVPSHAENMNEQIMEMGSCGVKHVSHITATN